MSEKELLCASLDNTSVGKSTENPNHAVTKQFPVKNIAKQAVARSHNDSPTISEHDIKATTAAYGEISLKNKDPQNKIEKGSNSDGNTALDSNLPDNPKLNSSTSKQLSLVESEEKLDDQDDSEEQDYDEDVMTGSYGEISLDRDLLNCDKNADLLTEDEQCFPDDEINDKKRPNSLILNASATTSKVNDAPQQVHQSMQTSMIRTDSAEASPSLSSEEFAVHSSSRVRTGSDTSGLSELQGTLTVDGDVVTFVAEDLAEKIKMSSPVSRWTDASSFGGSRSSTPSLYKQALQPSHHIIDPNVITDLEAHAKKVATCVDTMLENLSGTLQSISSLTVDCMETYENSVCKTCDAVDLNIKAVYQLMAKCEELNNSMGPLYCLSSDIKYIKMMLEQLEHIVEHRS